MSRAAWALLVVVWFVETALLCAWCVLVAALIAGCSRDALPVPSDMSAARDAEPLGDCTLIGWHLECADFGPCANNSDCHAGRCIYDSCSDGHGICVAYGDGGIGCGGSMQVCCSSDRCVAGHRCSGGFCVVC